MTPLLSEHAGILYPSDLHELGKLIAPGWITGDLPPLDPLEGLPAAIIVPHASYGYCLQFIRQAFSSTLGLQPELIVALAPLHRPCLREDSDRGVRIFAPESTLWETPGGIIKLDEPKMNALAIALAADFDRCDCYFQEEYAIELLLPFCLHRFPAVPLLPLLADLHNEAGQLAAGKAIQFACAGNSKSLFVISSNSDSNCGNGWIDAINQVSDSEEWNLGVKTPYLCASKEWK